MNPEHNKNFAILKERPPFKTFGKDAIPTHENYLTLASEWIKDLSSEDRTKFIAARSQIFQLLDVKSFTAIQDIIGDKEKRAALSKRAYKLFAKTYEIKGVENEVELKINGYGEKANSVIKYLKKKDFLSDFSMDMDLINDVKDTNNPIDLLLMIYDNNFDPRARFEAKRKLTLMRLSAAVDLRDRETGNKNHNKNLTDFLREFVYEGRAGETDKEYILSYHDLETFACKKWEKISEEEKIAMERQKKGLQLSEDDMKSLEELEKRGVKNEKFQKITELRWRKFKLGNKIIPIQVSPREKDDEAVILKLLRKGEENPAVAVEDNVGIFGVVKKEEDSEKFQIKLVEGATKIGCFLDFEGMHNNLNDGEYKAVNVGSSSGLRQLNYFIKMSSDIHTVDDTQKTEEQKKEEHRKDTMRIEVIMDTVETYLDYLYKRGVSHDEYEINRLFDSGVMDMLFPKSFYNINWQEKKPQVIQDVRERLER